MRAFLFLGIVLSGTFGPSFAPLSAQVSAPVSAQGSGSIARAQRPAKEGRKSNMSFYDLTAQSIDLEPQTLSAWKGKVALVVNTASECGSTPQYADLEKLWQEYQGRGLVILGFPSNDFGGQEPGSEAQIKKFCQLKYRVTFPMFAKVQTRGPGQSPVYQFLTAKHGEPRWNFHKYLVGKDGQVIGAFETGVQPSSPELRAAIDAALK